MGTMIRIIQGLLYCRLDQKHYLNSIFRNWSPAKRAFVAFSISFLTFSVYIGSAIYTPAIPGLMAEFNVSQTTATLGLTLYVLGKLFRV